MTSQYLVSVAAPLSMLCPVCWSLCCQVYAMTSQCFACGAAPLSSALPCLLCLMVSLTALFCLMVALVQGVSHDLTVLRQWRRTPLTCFALSAGLSAPRSTT